MVDATDRIERSLRFEAAKNLRGTENIRKALLWIKHNPEGLRNRIKEFDLVCEDINSLFSSTQDSGRFGNVISLKEKLSGNKVLKLSELTGGLKTDESVPLSTIEDAFKDIDQLTKSGEWRFPTSIIDNPNQLASALLIEGYGLLLEKHFGKKGLARVFVLSFEEVLWSNHKDFETLRDVKPWMVEEANDFSPEIAKELKP